VGDAAVFGGLVLYFAGTGAHQGDSQLGVVLALTCLVLGSLTSYARARAEGIGLRADVGIAERSDRLVAILVTTGFVGIGGPKQVLIGVLALLAVASLTTVIQRILYVRKQALGRRSAPRPAQDPPQDPPDLPVGSLDV
jgi:CDP-diacylglycerol--glycerol-3-phosphate 3-phosphatidyltransferase